MKRLILLVLLLVAALPLMAQDMIVRRDGSVVQAKILEVSSSEIKYKKFAKHDGPLFVLKTSEIISINYEDGEVERYDQAVEPAPQAAAEPAKPAKPQLIEVVADANNQALLDKYNNSQVKILKQKDADKEMKRGYYKFGFTQNSILSNRDIEVTYLVNDTKIRFNWIESHRDIRITNKTDQTIYVDLARCFRINLDGSSHTYYDGSRQTSVTNAGSTGVSVHLGAGVSIGGGNAGATTTTYTNERVLTIPPHSHAYLSTLKMVGKEFITKGEPWKTPYAMPWEVKRWKIYDFTEADTPGKFSYTITYSKDADFSTYSRVKAELYIQQVFGFGFDDLSGKWELEWDKQSCIVAYYSTMNY